MKEIKDAEFDAEISSGLCLVDFFATWCGPCKMLSPLLDEIAKQLTDVKFLKVNIEDNGVKADELGVKALPTLILFKDGKEKARNIGLVSQDKLIEWINKNKE